MRDDRENNQNQGEGDRESARRYNAHLREFIASPGYQRRVEQLRGVTRRIRTALGDLISSVRRRVATR